MMRINKKGQAAVTDALIFLSIVGVLSTMMITSAMNYGLDVIEGAESNYAKTYSDNVLKTFYSSTYGRDGSMSLESNNSDYLMTQIKEEFDAKDKTIREQTKKNILKSLDNIVLLNSQKSYMISFVYEQGDSTNATSTKSLFTAIRTLTKEGQRVYIECEPSSITDFIQTFISEHKLNLTSSYAKTVYFENIVNGEETKKIDGETMLFMWTSVPDFEDMPSGEINQVDFILFTNEIYNNEEFGCTFIELERN